LGLKKKPSPSSCDRDARGRERGVQGKTKVLLKEERKRGGGDLGLRGRGKKKKKRGGEGEEVKYDGGKSGSLKCYETSATAHRKHTKRWGSERNGDGPKSLRSFFEAKKGEDGVGAEKGAKTKQ